LTEHFDFILVGGGLANGLIAHRLAEKRPDISFCLLEHGPSLGGNHTWSFHTHDVSPGALPWLRPLISASWDIHQVRFPAGSRELRSGYHSIRSSDFHRALVASLGDRVRFGVSAEALRADGVRLAGGSWIGARRVLDGRGFGAGAGEPGGYQTFFGQDVRLAEAHGLAGPILMDATCEQRGGFRFFYVLPWSANELLIEDTRYTDSPVVDEREGRQEVEGYARKRGWRICRVLREETGCLPIPFTAPRRGQGPVVEVGVRAGLFHATTGYSFPDAVRIADRIAGFTGSAADLARSLPQLLAAYGRRHRSRQRFCRFLNRMLFLGVAPERRFELLQRFYRLPTPLVERFYAGSMTFRDRARILAGRPPIPVRSAIRCLFYRQSDSPGGNAWPTVARTFAVSSPEGNE
jgi:lycopene beta-cyclase